MSEFLIIESGDGYETVTLNRPEVLNALSPEMAVELLAYFRGLAARSEARVVLLRGAGRAFCAGAELGSDAFVGAGPGRMQQQMAAQHLYSGIVRAMRACPQPIIALVHGPACGGGFSLVLAADVRIAADDARMNAAYLRVGLGGCDMGSGYLLPRLVGLSVASELLLTGNFIGAQRALAVGLVSAVVPAENLMRTGLDMAAAMLRASPMGLRMTKETLNQSIDAPSLDAALTMEDRQQVILLGTDDHQEAVSAFTAKRSPNYRNE